MASIEGVRLKLRRIYIKITAKYRNKLLNDTSFTIISNNCWGGFVYKSYNIQYNSPTIGLFFMADDYVKFTSNLKNYISKDLNFIEATKSKYYNELKEDKRFGNYPIGKLGDIEIMFLHYKDENEAYEKWTRRCERINWNKILVKFNDQNGCTEENLKVFNDISHKKVIFVSKVHEDIKSAVYIKSAKNQKEVYASQEPFGRSKYINITKILNDL